MMMMMMMTTDHLSAESSCMMPLRHPALGGGGSCVISGSFSCFTSSDESHHSWMDVTCHLPPLTLKLYLLCPSFTRGTFAPSPRFGREKYLKFSSSTFNSLLMLTSAPTVLYTLSANSVFIAQHIPCSRFLSHLPCFHSLAPACVAPTSWHYACARGDFQLTIYHVLLWPVRKAHRLYAPLRLRSQQRVIWRLSPSFCFFTPAPAAVCMRLLVYAWLVSLSVTAHYVSVKMKSTYPFSHSFWPQALAINIKT